MASRHPQIQQAQASTSVNSASASQKQQNQKVAVNKAALSNVRGGIRHINSGDFASPITAAQAPFHQNSGSIEIKKKSSAFNTNKSQKNGSTSNMHRYQASAQIANFKTGSGGVVFNPVSLLQNYNGQSQNSEITSNQNARKSPTPAQAEQQVYSNNNSRRQGSGKNSKDLALGAQKPQGGKFHVSFLANHNSKAQAAQSVQTQHNKHKSGKYSVSPRILTDQQQPGILKQSQNKPQVKIGNKSPMAPSNPSTFTITTTQQNMNFNSSSTPQDLNSNGTDVQRRNSGNIPAGSFPNSSKNNQTKQQTVTVSSDILNATEQSSIKQRENIKVFAFKPGNFKIQPNKQEDQKDIQQIQFRQISLSKEQFKNAGVQQKAKTRVPTANQTSPVGQLGKNIFAKGRNHSSRSNTSLQNQAQPQTEQISQENIINQQYRSPDVALNHKISVIKPNLFKKSSLMSNNNRQKSGSRENSLESARNRVNSKDRSSVQQSTRRGKKKVSSISSSGLTKNLLVKGKKQRGKSAETINYNLKTDSSNIQQPQFLQTNQIAGADKISEKLELLKQSQEPKVSVEVNKNLDHKDVIVNHIRKYIKVKNPGEATPEQESADVQSGDKTELIVNNLREFLTYLENKNIINPQKLSDQKEMKNLIKDIMKLDLTKFSKPRNNSQSHIEKLSQPAKPTVTEPTKSQSQPKKRKVMPSPIRQADFKSVQTQNNSHKSQALNFEQMNQKFGKLNTRQGGQIKGQSRTKNTSIESQSSEQIASVKYEYVAKPKYLNYGAIAPNQPQKCNLKTTHSGQRSRVHSGNSSKSSSMFQQVVNHTKSNLSTANFVLPSSRHTNRNSKEVSLATSETNIDVYGAKQSQIQSSLNSPLNSSSRRQRCYELNKDSIAVEEQLQKLKRSEKPRLKTNRNVRTVATTTTQNSPNSNRQKTLLGSNVQQSKDSTGISQSTNQLIKSVVQQQQNQNQQQVPTIQLMINTNHEGKLVGINVNNYCFAQQPSQNSQQHSDNQSVTNQLHQAANILQEKSQSSVYRTEPDEQSQKLHSSKASIDSLKQNKLLKHASHQRRQPINEGVSSEFVIIDPEQTNQPPSLKNKQRLSKSTYFNQEEQYKFKQQIQMMQASAKLKESKRGVMVVHDELDDDTSGNGAEARSSPTNLSASNQIIPKRLQSSNLQETPIVQKFNNQSLKSNKRTSGQSNQRNSSISKPFDFHKQQIKVALESQEQIQINQKSRESSQESLNKRKKDPYYQEEVKNEPKNAQVVLNDPVTEERQKLIRYIKAYIEKHGKIPNTTLDFYRFVKLLGKGAFGKITLGIHKLTGKYVAIKSIDKVNIKDDYSRRKVFQEVYILKKIRHSCVIRLLEVFESEKQFLMVMEYSGGGDLLQYVKKRKRLNEQSSKAIFKQILYALGHCHCRSVLHRDIKLDNVLMDGEGGIKLCDFGVSRLVKKGHIINEQCGTPAYLAPEIILDQGYQGFAADVWSLGILLYAMIQGTVPFKAHNITDLHKLILKGEFEFPVDTVSDSVKDLVRKMLILKPADRISIPSMLNHPWVSDMDLNAGIAGTLDDSEHDLRVGSTFFREEVLGGLISGFNNDKNENGNINFVNVENLYYRGGPPQKEPQTAPEEKVSYSDYCALTEDFMTYRIDEDAMEIVTGFGYPRELVIKSINRGDVNHATTAYYLLVY